MTLKRNTLYPKASLPHGYAVWDGLPKRNPRKGEWYLSGAIIQAYHAPYDLPSEYHIAIPVATVKCRACGGSGIAAK